jgi:hypothetical protein
MRCPEGLPSAASRDRFDVKTFRLLSAALSAAPAPSDDVALALADRTAMGDMLALAREEGVIPALWERVARFGEIVPRNERIVLAAEHEANRRRNAEIRAAIIEIGTAAAQRGIEFVVLKGAAWVMEDGESFAAWRTMVDIDLLVDEANYQAIPALATEIGYRPASEARRFRENFHHAPFWRDGCPASVEVHRHLGWRHQLLAPETMREGATLVAPGLYLPRPWCRAIHAIIHWQVQNFGLSRASSPLKEILEVTRFLGRADVEWDRLAEQARTVAVEHACGAAVALAATVMNAPAPPALALDGRDFRHARLALRRRASPWRTWLATEIWRAGTLWRCQKIAYRLTRRGWPGSAIHMALALHRTVRAPLLLARIVGIVAKAGRRRWL